MLGWYAPVTEFMFYSKFCSLTLMWSKAGIDNPDNKIPRKTQQHGKGKDTLIKLG